MDIVNVVACSEAVVNSTSAYCYHNWKWNVSGS